MSEVATPEEYQKKFDEKVNEVLSVIEGLTAQESKVILESAICRLPAHSYVQFEKQH